jgi:hypothetical protein
MLFSPQTILCLSVKEILGYLASFSNQVHLKIFPFYSLPRSIKFGTRRYPASGREAEKVLFGEEIEKVEQASQPAP